MHRGGGRAGGGRPFNSFRDQQEQDNRTASNFGNNRMNDTFNRNMPQNRLNPWDVSPSNMGGNSMGGSGMGANTMGNTMGGNGMAMGRNPNNGSNNMNNMGSNRPMGGLLPTPNMPMQGLLPSPSVQDVQLAVASNVLNLLLPNRPNQQTNQMPSLLGPSPNCAGLLPLNPPVINPFNNQNFRPQGSQQNTGGSNRGARSNIPSRRVDPYNKMGNRNQRPGQNNDERKSSNTSPRRAFRGSGLSPKNVVEHSKNVKDEKVDSRKNQKTDDSSKELVDKDKIKAEFVDIPCDKLSCHVCKKNMGDPFSFVCHIRGKSHLSAMDRKEEEYKTRTENLRQQMKVEEQQRQISLGQNRQPNEYCTMCNLHFSGNLSLHRKGPKHQELKLFLHPRCNICDKEFATRIDYDQHLLTVGHLKISAKVDKRATQYDTQNNDSNQETVKKIIKIKTEPEPKKSPEAPSTTVKVAVKKEIKVPKSIESEEEKLPDYDSQKEIGMEMLQEKTGYLCRCCNRFLSCSADAKTHCRSQFHYDKYITYMKSQPIVVNPLKQNGSERSACNKTKAKTDATKDKINQKDDDKANLPEDDEKMDEGKDKEVPEPEDDEEDEEDEGNWKRRKVSKDDISMDVTLPVNKEKSNKEGNDEDKPTVVKHAEDEQSLDIPREDLPKSSVTSVAL